MSPSENNPSQAPETVGSETPAPVDPETTETQDQENPTVASEAPEQKSPKRSSRTLKQKAQKKLSKKTKIALLVAGWVLLLGIGAGAALIIKPAPEVVYTDAITEAYKFSQQESTKATDTVDDLDYYGYYTANPLTFSRVGEGKAKGVYTISGLKNKTVEDKINNRIVQAASALRDTSPEHGDIYMEITANYFNLLSFYFHFYDGKAWQKYYYTLDLNTGDELRFENLFSANANVASLFFKSFYDYISTSIQFDKLYAERRLAAESYAPNPAQCAAQYCPLPGETYDSIRALIADYDNQMANIEQITIDAIQKYLAGEKKFCLGSSGPVLILADGSTISVALKDNIRYAIYLKNYRSPSSIFEDDSIAASNLFFTEVPTPYYDYFNEETDNYLFSYAEGKSVERPVSPAIRQSFRDYIKNKGLSAPGDKSKFRYIYADGNVSEGDRIRTGYVSICATEVDKSYYDSVYKKSIIDGGVRHDWISPVQTGQYDADRVTDIPIEDDGVNYCSQQKHVVITNSGAVIDDVDDILVTKPGWEDWRDSFRRDAYSYNCSRSWDPVCYTDEEKQSHEIVYEFTGSGITMYLKNDSEPRLSYFYHINLENKLDYINPEILIKPPNVDSYL